MMWILILFFTLSFADDVVDTMGNIATPAETSQRPTSPFLACQRANLSINQPLFFSPRIPRRDHQGMQTIDAIRALQAKIQGQVENHVRFNENLVNCLRTVLPLSTETCGVIRNWVDPAQFPLPPPQENTPENQSIVGVARAARQLLTIAGDETFGRDIFRPNEQLSTTSFKIIPWEPATRQELARAAAVLNGYRHHLMIQFNLTASQIRDFEHSSVYRRIGRSNRNDPTLQFWRLQREVFRQMGNVRSAHLDQYRYLMSQYPILSYISSSSPNVTEIRSAAERMRGHAQSELNYIQEIGTALNNADSDHVPGTGLDLLDYQQQVEELLQAHPEYCGVLSAAQAARTRRRIQTAAGLGLPLMAVSMAAPPAAAVSASAIATGIGSYRSYSQFMRDVDSAHSLPIGNDATRVAPEDLENSVRRSIVEIPIYPIFTGVFRAGWQVSRGASNHMIRAYEP